MISLALALVLLAALVAAAVVGPWMLRRAAPMLVRVPRVAIGVIFAGALVWIGSVLALGPLLAWSSSAPALLPASAAAVCQRCLDAANPFSGGATQLAVPALLLLVVPAVAGAALVAGVARQLMSRSRSAAREARKLLDGSQQQWLLGHRVQLIETQAPIACAVAGHRGAVVVSTGALALLDRDELAAVLAHEQAHLSQHHHALRATMGSVATYLAWIPMIRAVSDVLPLYLEIAADDRARRTAGTNALVGALLKLGQRPQVRANSSAAALHAAGPERVAALVNPVTGSAGVGAATAASMGILALAVMGVLVHLPYASAALAGCS